jgi:hypothetical protein
MPASEGAAHADGAQVPREVSLAIREISRPIEFCNPLSEENPHHPFPYPQAKTRHPLPDGRSRGESGVPSIEQRANQALPRRQFGRADSPLANVKLVQPALPLCESAMDQRFGVSSVDQSGEESEVKALPPLPPARFLKKEEPTLGNLVLKRMMMARLSNADPKPVESNGRQCRVRRTRDNAIAAGKAEAVLPLCKVPLLVDLPADQNNFQKAPPFFIFRLDNGVPLPEVLDCTDVAPEEREACEQSRLVPPHGKCVLERVSRGDLHKF